MNERPEQVRAATPEAVEAVEPARPPSPPWYGGIAIGMIGLMATILLTYTLLDWQWQQDLGWWNYAVTIALIPIASVLIRFWRPDGAR